VKSVRDNQGSSRFTGVCFSTVNSINDIAPEAASLPDVFNLIDQLDRAKFRARIDLSKVDWLAPLQPMSKCCSAFVTPFGLITLSYKSFGLRNTQANLEALVLDCLADIETFVEDHLHGSIWFGVEWMKYLRRLSHVFMSTLSLI
jgi:hypothetical protein